MGIDMDFKDSETYKNLRMAYDGERMASTKYRIYSDKARKDGYEEIGNVFDETAGNEKEHAEIWLKYLNQGAVPDTLANLTDSYQGESYEWRKMYPEYAETAMREGYPQLAKLFREVAKIEQHHEYRFKEEAQDIMDRMVFCKGKNTVWICMNCGNLYYGACAPEKCPVCGYPQGYYTVLEM